MSDVVWGRCPNCGEPCFLDWITREVDPDHTCPPVLAKREVTRKPWTPPAGRVVVFHGTHAAFRSEVAEKGMRARGKGVRCALDPETAWGHARAWACFLMAERHMPPKGMLAYALVDVGRVREEVPGVRYRVPGGLRADELRFEEKELPECYDPGVARIGLDLFEQLSERPKSGILIPRGAPHLN